MSDFRRAAALAFAIAWVASACGDDAPAASPEQSEAIDALIDVDLTSDEESCLLDGLIQSGIEPEAVVDGTLNGDQDATLLGVTLECVADPSRIPEFVESFIEGAALDGVTLTDAQARCAIDALGEVDDPDAVAACLSEGADTSADDADDKILELLNDQCAAGNNQACDELYRTSPPDSEYEEFGRTCGGVLPDSIGYRCFVDLDGGTAG